VESGASSVAVSLVRVGALGAAPAVSSEGYVAARLEAGPANGVIRLRLLGDREPHARGTRIPRPRTATIGGASAGAGVTAARVPVVRGELERRR
jgi:hypothetical protein